MIKVLVTGATGFVGLELISQLSNQTQIETYRIVRKHSQARSEHDRVVPYINGKTDWSGVLQNIDVVVHLAAKVHDMSYKDNDDINNEYYQVNTEGTKKLVRDAIVCGVQKIIFLSTIKVNGDSEENIVFTETDKPKPHGSYAKSKFMAEQYLISNFNKNGHSYIIIRPTLILGDGVKGNLYKMMNLIFKGIPIPFSKFDNKRSMIGLKNLCDFIIYSILSNQCNNNIYLLSEKNAISTRELCEKIAYYMNKKLLKIMIPKFILSYLRKIPKFNSIYIRAYGDLVVSTEKLISTSGWHYKYSVEEQVKSMVKAFK